MTWIEKLAAYEPKTEEERDGLAQILSAAEREGEGLLDRLSPEHITCTGFVMNPALDAVLFVYHNIYKSYSWTGGHADGDPDFLKVAMREVREETGIKSPFLLMGEILSVDILSVAAHNRKGDAVPAHRHFNITYGLIANPKEPVRAKPDENSDVAWIPVSQIEERVTEPHMLPIYQKMIARVREQRRRQAACMEKIASPLISWFPGAARAFPWRGIMEPYKVWISEIMLQQTRTEAVKAYYTRFLDRFPDISSLAAASQDEVNKYWEGLGYYSRAKNIRGAAQKIVADFGGAFPQSIEDIRALPGVGSYTAGAIASICFGLPSPAVDGNVLRVAARVTNCFCEIDRPAMKTTVTKNLEETYLQNLNSCNILTQALMELGATVCVPNGVPLCESCPLRAICLSKKAGTSDALPKRLPKKRRRREKYTVFLLHCGGTYALHKRADTGLLAGLWEWPNVAGICTLEQALEQASAWECHPLDLERTMPKKHIFTHIEWEMLGVEIACQEKSDVFVWVTLEEIRRRFSLPTAFRQFLGELDAGGT